MASDRRVKFSGIVVKPLDQQQDEDRFYFDPAGIRFDPEREYVVQRDFDPQTDLGTGKLSRAEDGSIIMTGELNAQGARYVEHGDRMFYGAKLAVGVYAEDYEYEEDGSALLKSADFMSVAMTYSHKDPAQPATTIDG